jgi:hypothetical protein
MNYLSTYIAALLVFGSFGVVGLVATAHGFEQPHSLVHVALVVFAILVAAPIHQAGHWLAGAAQGFRCLRFLVGPVELAPGEKGWRVRLVPFRQAGVVHQVPSSFANFRLQKGTCLAAGPCLSLIAGLLFTSLALRAVSATFFWLWIVNAQMCLLGVLDLAPLSFGGVESDGGQLWKILQGGAQVDTMQIDLLADSVNHTALRPRDWPAELMRRVASMPGQPHQRRYCLYMAYIHYLDAGDIAVAGPLLSELLESWTPSDGPQYAIEAAYFLALHRQDSGAARNWLAREPRLSGEALRLRAEAAIECAAGNDSAALKLIELAQSRLQDAPAVGHREFEMACLNRMHEGISARGLAAELGVVLSHSVYRAEQPSRPEYTQDECTAPLFWPEECEKPAAS